MSFGLGLLIGFILGVVASAMANWLGYIARSMAKRALRKNIKVTLLKTPQTYSQLGVTLWLVELRTTGNLWNKLVFNEVSLEMSTKALFTQLSEPNDRCLGQIYDTTLGFGAHAIQFQLKSDYPRQLAVMQRNSNMLLHPFITTWVVDLKGDWDMEIQVIEDGQIIYRKSFPCYIKNGNPDVP